MDQIFGKGSIDDIFSPRNGLLLHKHIESALDKGYFAIVPDVDIDPQDPSMPEMDQAARRDRLKEWERMSPKEFKAMVLDSKPQAMREKVFPLSYPVQTLAELHGRKLTFLNEFRPKSRYVWWTYLHGLTQVSWRAKAGGETLIQKEVAKGMRYWDTRGPYIKRNQLLGFVEQIGHDVESIESILEHAVEEDAGIAEEAEEANMTGLAVISDEVVRRAQENDGYDYEEDQDENMEDQDEDTEVT